MWFDNAHGKEKIKSIFDNKLSLDNSLLELILYHSESLLSIRFRVDRIPNSIPDKWRKRNFDFIDVNVDFCFVEKIECHGGALGFRCTPIFGWNNNKQTLLIKNKNFYLYCASESMFIGEITPFHCAGE